MLTSLGFLLLTGRLDCTRTPPEIKIDVARVRLANNIDFPEDLRDTFNEIVEQAGMVYPPPDLDAADAMYLHLRAEAHAQLDWNIRYTHSNLSLTSEVYSLSHYRTEKV